ncbi:MAG: hypothetical protein GY858_00500 [Candidatus Omnitrophica bacterium]|nr:hypothetical protein [Candidatus Omnitrophota bacterium]
MPFGPFLVITTPHKFGEPQLSRLKIDGFALLQSCKCLGVHIGTVFRGIMF